ncbi:MAG: hypothetical protein HY720_22255 [Planctomycetes bacterium]|nr:hypothetical protein [Planctomycetota bacterium]
MTPERPNRKRSFRVVDRTAWHAAGRPEDRKPFIRKVALRLPVLPAWAHLSSGERARRFRELVAEQERTLRAERRKEGRSVLGVQAILRQDPFARPQNTKHSPRPLCHASTPEAREEYRQAYQAFLALYRQASARYRAGERDVQFPLGSFPPWWRGAA